MWMSNARRVPTNCLPVFSCTKISLPFAELSKSKGLSIPFTIDLFDSRGI